MPAWWKLRSKKKPASSASPSPPQSPAKGKTARIKAEDLKLDGFATALGGEGSPVLARPLPRPSAPVATPLPSVTASSSVSESGSSISSAGTDDALDQGFCRCSTSATISRGRNSGTDLRRQLQVGNHITERYFETSTDVSTGGILHHCVRRSSENILTTATISSSTRATSLPSPTSPVRPVYVGRSLGNLTGRQDDIKCSPHPLPLPPNSYNSQLPPSSPSSPFRPGSPNSTSQSGQSQWKKGKLLGMGTFGHVYLGFHSESGQMCAIKEVNIISDDSNSKECLKQLNQEISMLRQLSHPNIVQYYGSELTDDKLSIYIEYVSGGSINKLLQDYGPFSETVIKKYTKQILSGLAYLHEGDTVHRDIKGANILVDPNGDIKLADFGMAKHKSAYNSISSLKGSPYWMAPEVIMNTNGYSLSVDIWSLGCTIIEMATSRPPWSQYDGVQAMFKIANSKDTVEIPDQLSAEGKNFLKLCLERNPALRPTASQLMNHAFVRDQNTSGVPRSIYTKNVLATSPGRDRTMLQANIQFSSHQSTPYSQGLDMRAINLTVPTSPVSFGQKYNNSVNPRMNLSLPVSPCSSPLRQFSQLNRNCLLSPPHPVYSAEAINYSPANNALYTTTRPRIIFTDPWLRVPE